MGSIQGIDEIPENIKNTFKTRETSNKILIDMAADKIHLQSQSLNFWKTQFQQPIKYAYVCGRMD